MSETTVTVIEEPSTSVVISEGSDSVTVDVSGEESVSVVTVGTQGPPGPPGPQGDPGEPGGLADEAWTEVDFAAFFDLINGVAVDLGTGGRAWARWTRAGRLIVATVYILAAPDASYPASGTWLLVNNPATLDLPGDPALPLPRMEAGTTFAVPHGFGYLVVPNASTVALPPAFIDLAGTADPANASIAFIVDAPLAPTGIEALGGPGNPVPISGQFFYQGRLMYEAAEAAP